jgi:hypothetical protein
MKVKIIKKEYYVAKTEDGKEYSVDIKDEKILNSYINDRYIDGDIIEDEIQDKFNDGTFARSYTIIQKFIPKNNK